MHYRGRFSPTRVVAAVAALSLPRERSHHASRFGLGFNHLLELGGLDLHSALTKLAQKGRVHWEGSDEHRYLVRVPEKREILGDEGEGVFDQFGPDVLLERLSRANDRLCPIAEREGRDKERERTTYRIEARETHVTHERRTESSTKMRCDVRKESEWWASSYKTNDTYLAYTLS